MNRYTNRARCTGIIRMRIDGVLVSRRGRIAVTLAGVLTVFGIVVGATLSFADVPCARCITDDDYSGCADQPCVTVQGQCLVDTIPDPEEPGETINVYVTSASYELVHLSDPKFCGEEGSSLSYDCHGTKLYYCYKKVSYPQPGCAGGQCEEFGSVLGCSVNVSPPAVPCGD